MMLLVDGHQYPCGGTLHLLYVIDDDYYMMLIIHTWIWPRAQRRSATVGRVMYPDVHIQSSPSVLVVSLKLPPPHIGIPVPHLLLGQRTI